MSRDPLGYVDGMNRFASVMMLDGLDPSGQLIIFVHGIKSTNDMEASILYEELCKPAQNWDSRGERQAMLHLRYGYAKKDYHPIFTDAVYGTWSDVNRRAGWYLAEYVKWLQKEKARLGSNEEIVVIAYSNGGNVAYEALMTSGVQVDRILLLGTSADTTLDWKTACDKSCCRIYNNWSDSDSTARLPNGAGNRPINALECKFIQDCYVEKCYHTADDALGHAGDTRRFSGRTSWLSRCMCREVYYRQLTDASGDGKLSAHGRMVDLVYKRSRQHGLKGPFFSPSVEFDFGKFEIGPWYRKTLNDASDKTLFPLPLR